MCVAGNTVKLKSFSKVRIDELLSEGYFRSGKSMFHCPVTFLDGTANTTIRTRLNLEGHSYRKSSRKLLANNKQVFTSNFIPLDLDEEVLALYEIYKEECFKGDLSGSLEDWLIGSFDKEIFETKMCKIYKEDQLVAVSFLDIGSKAVASIMGIYHPDFKKYSLGIYSMLLEVEYAKSLKMDFYYPGYILSQSPRFEYKKKVGNLEFLRFTENKWYPLDQLTYEDHLVEKTIDQLEGLQHYLKNFMIQSDLYTYPLFSWNSYPLNADLLEHYFFLKIGIPGYSTLFIAITYNALDGCFQLNIANSIGRTSPTWQEFLNYYPEPGNWLDTILIQQKGKKLKTSTSIPLILMNLMSKVGKSFAEEE